jgi:hypothetical protein
VFRSTTYGVMTRQTVPALENLGSADGVVPDTGRAAAAMAARSCGPAAGNAAGEAPKPGVGGVGAAAAVPTPASRANTAPAATCRHADARKSLTS